MLVLSRKLNQKVLFPAIQAAVQVLSVRGGVVRLGIDAPADVTVLREELLGKTDPAHPIALPANVAPAGLPRELAHQLRNRLNAATLGLAVLRKQRELGLTTESDITLNCIDKEIESLRQYLEAAGPPAPAVPTPAPARKRKALLVEDDSNERELLAGLLRLAGLEVVTAGDGLDALDYLHGDNRPDVVLLDMGLPRCDGAATVREIRRDPACADLKVFAVTGRTAEEFPASAGTGINRWFRKPVNPEELLRELQRELAVMN